jgi:SAM-dependent methyltransferase
MASFTARLKSLVSRVSFLRILSLLRRSVIYRIPPLRKRVTQRFTDTRSTDKLDPSYDIGLYDSYKQYLAQYHKAGYETMLDLGSGDGVLHAGQFILQDNVRTFYLVDEVFFPDFLDSRLSEFFKSDEKVKTIKAGLRLVPNMKDIPENSVDVVMSTSLFEHVLREEAADLINQLYAKLKPHGTAILSIDLRDHYDFAYPFFFYRHAEWLWKLMTIDRAKYTNRLRAVDFSKICTDAGFTIVHNIEESDDTQPLPKLAKPFRHYSEAELRVWHTLLILQKP